MIWRNFCNKMVAALFRNFHTVSQKCYTVWKSHNLYVNQILREIKVSEFKISKCTILAHSVSVNFDFNEYLQFLKADIYQINQIQSSKNVKMAILRTSRIPNLISRKIWTIVKSWSFHTELTHHRMEINFYSKNCQINRFLRLRRLRIWSISII